MFAAYSGDEPILIRDDPTSRFFNIVVSRMASIRWLAYAALIVLTYFERPTYVLGLLLDDTTNACAMVRSLSYSKENPHTDGLEGSLSSTNALSVNVCIHCAGGA